MSAAATQTTLHVSPKGQDTNPGTRDAPLRTLDGARNRVRAFKDREPVTVEFAAGTYAFSEAVSFTEADTGRADGPIVYRAASGADVRFTGGVEVSGWRAVSDADILERLPAVARGQVRLADLQAQGITDLGRLQVRGFAMGNPHSSPATSP